MAGISNIAGMALSYRSIRCLISFATFWAMMMIATSSRWEKLAKVDSISFVVVSAMRCDQTQNIFFWEGGRNEVRSDLLGDAFLAAGVLTRVDDEEVRVLPVVLVPDASEEEPRHRVLSGREKVVVVDGERVCVSELWSSSRPRNRRSSSPPESSGVSPRRR